MWVEGFPRGPGEHRVGRWIDYSCGGGGKNNSPTFQRNVFVMESLKGCSRRPRSEQLLGASQETELLLGMVFPGKAELGC